MLCRGDIPVVEAVKEAPHLTPGFVISVDLVAFTAIMAMQVCHGGVVVEGSGCLSGNSTPLDFNALPFRGLAVSRHFGMVF